MQYNAATAGVDAGAGAGAAVAHEKKYDVNYPTTYKILNCFYFYADPQATNERCEYDDFKCNP